jgi:predicted kinase
MALVGSHHEPKLLVVKNKERKEYVQLARRVDLSLVTRLARADMRGRICEDKDEQVGNIDLFSMGVQDYVSHNGYEKWRSYIFSTSYNESPEFRDRVFGEAIRAWEFGRIFEPEEANFLGYQTAEVPPELVVLCGPSGSGKSTFVEKVLPNYTVISLDEIREDFSKDRSDQSANGAVQQEAKLRLKTSLRPGKKVVWDATCLRKDFRSIVCQTGFLYGALVTLVVFQQPKEKYFERNQARTHAIPNRVLEAQLNQWEWPQVDEAHRVLILDSNHGVRGAFGFCDDNLPWGLSYVR